VREVETAVQYANHSYRPDSRSFRANIYVSGPTPFVETQLLRLAVQPAPSADSEPSEPLVFSISARTPRCIMPNIPGTGKRSRLQQPLRFLQHEGYVIDEGSKSPVLGMSALPLGEVIGRTVSVGDEVAFYKPGHHKYNPKPAKEDQTEIW
jgi:uncharacterized protein YcbX